MGSSNLRTVRPVFDELVAWRSHLNRIVGPLSRLRHYHLLLIAVHGLLVAAAFYIAFWLRFDGRPPTSVLATGTKALPWLLLIRSLMFASFGLYGGLWRYTGVWDLTRIVVAVVASSVAAYAPLYTALEPSLLPRSIMVIDSLLLISFVGGLRLIWRITDGASMSGSSAGRPVLVIGAGHAGEMIVREMRRGGLYNPVGFIDDNPLKVGRTIHGVTVRGTCNDLARVIAETQPQEVLVAMPSAKSAAIRSILHRLEPSKLPITTLPGLKDLVNSQVGVKQIRPLKIEDLLPRSPVTLNIAQVQQMVRGKRVLVTGAGGSIGSELCRHLAQLDPASLVLLDRYENGLHAVMNELQDRATGVPVRATIGDVTDAARIEAVFATHAPQLVFHAAAHKHVPLMEGNPCEAVKNNVAGTLTVVEAARRHAVERFVLISTDKAVNPSSVMGATKRVAELIVQAKSVESATRFVTVRFGNVLGSNGSVIPRMVDQIQAGGPVTVTHPEIRRYFMLIPEAVELVLQAAVLGRACETFVLDMGEQLKVLDVAKHLIRLSGLVPDEDVQITFVGLRPGEKLTEEFVGDGETLEPSGVHKIFRVQWKGAPDEAAVMRQVSELMSAAKAGDVSTTLARLTRLVPKFERPSASTPQLEDDAPARASNVRPEPSEVSPFELVRQLGSTRRVPG